MRLLLDTHALLWWLEDSPRLGAEARRRIADPDTAVLISAASLWEIAIKQRIGKLEADLGEIIGALRRSALTLLPIEPPHLLRLAELPAHHRDPFDHLLIAQAIVEDAIFVTGDRNAAAYPVQILSCAA